MIIQVLQTLHCSFSSACVDENLLLFLKLLQTVAQRHRLGDGLRKTAGERLKAGQSQMEEEWAFIYLPDKSRFSLKTDYRPVQVWSRPGTVKFPQHHEKGPLQEWMLLTEQSKLASPLPDYPRGRSSLVVKIKDQWLACYEFEPSTSKDPSCRGGRCTLNLSRFKLPPIDLVWK
ncbi:hypothetical protein TNCV_33481 [Trichonephila clavipes]|nr:hypothetical protein TNCV_33481 [Trichonephila clavipes]